MTTDDLAAVAPIRDPGALLATLPAILGFVPESSTIVVGLRREDGVTTVGPVMRQDLPGHPDLLAPSAAVVADICANGGVERALLVVVDGDAHGWADHIPTAETFAEVLGAHGCSLIAAYFAPQLADGSSWCEIDSAGDHPPQWTGDGDHRSGMLADPATRDLALVRLLGGTPVAADRRDLEAELLPVLRSRRRAVERAIDAHRGFPDRADARAAITEAVRDAGRTDHRANSESMHSASIRLIADVAVAVRDVSVRDVALGIEGAERAAERLWTAVGRHLSGSDRATALTLAGYHAYARGDGARAGIAFAAALDADPTHRLGALLDDALRIGMSPTDVRSLSVVADRVSADIDADTHTAARRYRAADGNAQTEAG
ncbi:DUF4192 domain-containing protein [Millisia brevis]|uniref:DUF4192 domain-containing protein n=1 Tax=Millisia brevis TaxID=264148 RepID=UPI00082E8A46|nr:DUF4192 domain-containing protein [Millisia brevis]